MIVMKELTVSYKTGQLALDRLSLTVEKPGIIGVIGPNGAGKSTLMKAILNLVEHEGETQIDNKPSQEKLSDIAYVEQKSQIDLAFPMTVKECVALGLYKKRGLFRKITKQDWEKVTESLVKVGLEAYENSPINALSGGQFQRMLVARCLIQEAQYIFLDEPFVGIDSISESMIMTLLRELSSEGKTIFIVHHDLHKVKQYFDQLLIMNKKLIAFGPVTDVYTRSYLEKAYGPTLFVESEVLG